jgi:hypothetical protein
MSVHRLEDSAVSRPPYRDSAGDHRSTNQRASQPRSAWITAAVMLAGVGGVYLVQQQWTHLAGNWVYLILLACPLMHLFMHGSHGGHGDHHTPRIDRGGAPDSPGPEGLTASGGHGRHRRPAMRKQR